MNFSENTVRDIEDGSEQIIKSKVEKNLGMTMTIGNIVEMDGRWLSDFEEENTWTLNSVNTIISNSSQICEVEGGVILFLLIAEHPPPPYFDARS